jgi:hypothetical protein
MKTLVTFCQKTGRRLRQYINRQIAKLSHKGQLKISVAFCCCASRSVAGGASRQTSRWRSFTSASIEAIALSRLIPLSLLSVPPLTPVLIGQSRLRTLSG